MLNLSELLSRPVKHNPSWWTAKLLVHKLKEILTPNQHIHVMLFIDKMRELSLKRYVPVPVVSFWNETDELRFDWDFNNGFRFTMICNRHGLWGNGLYGPGRTINLNLNMEPATITAWLVAAEEGKFLQ